MSDSPDCDALVRAVTAPYIAHRFVTRAPGTPPAARSDPEEAL